MISDGEIIKFRGLTHGCLSPKGELISCDYYQHLTVMGVEEYYNEIHSEYWDAAHEQVQWEMEDCGDDYYHPAWHRFEIGDDTRERAYLEAYNRGWVRLTYNNRQKVLYAESTQETARKQEKDLKFIADCLGLSLDIHIQK